MTGGMEEGMSETMTWPQLRAIWDARDERYEARAHPKAERGRTPRRGWRPSWESVEAARAYRASEAGSITDEDGRRHALRFLAGWDVSQ